MNLTQVQKIQLKNAVERVLHSPGNYQGGILEMCIAIDCSYEKESIRDYVKDLVNALKSYGEVFRNIRMNIVVYQSDNSIKTEIVPAGYLQMGKYFETYSQTQGKKNLGTLFDYLKFYHARSKLIMVLASNDCKIEDRQQALSALQPFLYHKLILMKEEKIQSGQELYHSLIIST